MLGHSRPVAKRCFACVTGFRVDFVQNHHLRFPLRPAEIDVGQDQHDRHELGDQSQAHHFVPVFVVERPAFGKAAHADHQHNDNGGDRQENKDKKGIQLRAP